MDLRDLRATLSPGQVRTDPLQGEQRDERFSTDADVETYIQPYNAAGFLCQVETDWLQRIFHNAHKPVMTIKPLAAGRLLPPTGLAFVWSTLRDCDMVTIGTLSPYQAAEAIELSLSFLEKRSAGIDLQYTRSKSGLVGARR